MLRLLTLILFTFLTIPSTALATSTPPPANLGEQEMMQENIPDSVSTTARVLEIIEEGTELDEMT
ncbi:hypothetical protein, partial [Planococcus halotolerans]